MPVTLPLPFRKFTASPAGRRRATAQVVATATALTAGFGLLTAGADSDNEQITPVAVVVPTDAPAQQAASAIQAPPAGSGAQHAPAVAAPAFWEPHRIVIDHAPPPPPPPPPSTVRPVNGILTSGFGQRWGTAHNGIDFAGPLGEPIFSVTDGTVIEAGPASGFGLWVRIQQDDGTVGVYGHMQDILVQVGQHVRPGDTIATVGSRGQSTGPHLHYEVHTPDGTKIDPAPWLAARGVDVNAFPG